MIYLKLWGIIRNSWK